MSGGNRALLLDALRSPAMLAELDLKQWETLIREARRSSLLPRLAFDADALHMASRIPEQPRAHLEAARAQAIAHAAAVKREMRFIDRALRPLGIPVVLLKGAAYLIGDLTAARGRLFSDVDILVPRSALPKVESALMLNGWTSLKTTPYDQRYYRRWMHELPPLKHHTRQTVLDVHHAILPITARLKPDSAKLLAASRPIVGEAHFRVLAPVDMVLHGATHLFCNEDVGNSLRDLVDLDCLLRDFAVGEGFWTELTARARELDLTRPLYYALRYAARVLETPVPVGVLGAADLSGPPSWLRGLMDRLFMRTLDPTRERESEGLTRLARGSLYVRAHWLRMPPLLLARHLMTKALRREEAGAH
jgi:hypothetical protein